MKKKGYYDDGYEGMYEREYESMEIGEKLESVLHLLEGTQDALVKLLGIAEEGLALEKEQKKAQAKEALEHPSFKVGVDKVNEKKDKVAAEISRLFGNL